MAKPVHPKLALARLKACQKWPYASHAILSMVPVEVPNLRAQCAGPLAVDQYWRLYYDPDFVDQVPPGELIGIIMHEVAHLLLEHAKRRKRYVSNEDRRGLLRWNIAADIAINEMVFESGGELPDFVVTHDKFGYDSGLSAEAYYMLLKKDDEQRDKEEEDERSERSDDSGGQDEDPGEQGEGEEQPGGENDSDGDADSSPGDSSDQAGDEAGDGHSGPSGEADDGEADSGSDSEDSGEEPGTGGEGTGEAGDEPEQSDGGSGSSGGDAASDGCGSGQSHGGRECSEPGGEGGETGGDAEPIGTGGSCADGFERPWELPPRKGDDDGEEEVPGLDPWETDVLLQNVANRIKKAGAGKGGMQRVVDQITEPKFDPRRLLMRAINKAMGNLMSGHGRFSYRRPSRRPSLGGTLRPRNFAPVPRILVIIDTSGSMGGDELSLALGLVGKCLHSLRLRDGLQVITGDVGAAWAEKIVDPSKVVLAGGGGTDMGAIMVDAVENSKPHERPQLMIVVTDGATPWPERDLKVPTVACITDPRYSGGGYWGEMPSWVERIDIFQEARA